MSMLKNLIGGLRGLLRKREAEEELDEELRAYLEANVEAKLRAGMSPADALRAARAEMGSVASVKDRVYQAGWESALYEFGRDLRFGARLLRRNPGVTLIAVLTLALGIGMNTGVFNILNGAAVRLLPVPHADELVMVSQDFDTSHGPLKRNVHLNASFFSYSEYVQYRDHNQVFSGLLAYSPFVMASLNGDRPQQLIGTLASCNYFSVLEVPLQLGNGFNDTDCRTPGSAPVVVLSDDLWRTSFAADPAVAGKTVKINRTAFTVVGVAPAGFQGTEPVPSQFWAPLTMQKTLMRDARYFEDQRMSWLGLIGRSKPNVSRTQTQADLAVIASQIDQEQPGRVTIIKVANATLFAVPEERFFFLSAGGVLLVAVGLILLIACANIANLLLSRATVRRKEIAVKRALGASRWRLIRQLLAESLLLAIVGGTLGSAIATWLSRPLLRLLLSHLPEGLPPLALDAGPDIHVLAYALGITLLTGIAFGLAPAIHATRAELSLAMKEEGAEAQSGSSRGGWLRNTLVGIQVAVCMALLLTAGLLLRGLTRAQTIDPGFSMKDIAVASFDLVGSGYNEGRAAAFQQQLAERVAAIPGIDRVAQAGVSPLSDNHVGSNFSVPGRNQDYDLEFTNVSPEYFPLLHIPLVRGRNFTVAETRAGSPVAILTETTARQLWPGEDPIGKHLREGSGGTDPGMEIVGVVKDVQLATLGETTTPLLFRPAGPKDQTRLLLMAHGTGDRILKNIKTAAQALDPDLAVNVTRLEDNMETWRSRSRIVSVLSAVLGGLALLLASLGVYGMVAYAAIRRVREIGIRMALGADVRDIMWLIVRQGMRPVWIGAAVGVVCCAAISNLMSRLLYGVSPWDPVSFLFVPGLLVVVAMAACWVPARRAAQADPVESLRCG